MICFQNETDNDEKLDLQQLVTEPGAYYCLATNGVSEARVEFFVLQTEESGLRDTVLPTVTNAKLAVSADDHDFALLTWEDNPGGLRSCGGTRTAEDVKDRKFQLRTQK